MKLIKIVSFGGLALWAIGLAALIVKFIINL